MFQFPGYLLVVFLAYVLGVWGYSVPLTGDQKVYVSTSLEMWQHGSWLTPWLCGTHTYIKPPLVNWTVLAGWSVFGVNPLGTFLLSALAVVATAFFLGKISGRGNAGLWFAATFGTLTYGGAVQMEIWIVLLYSAAWWYGLQYLSNKKAWYLFLAFVIAGALSLIKSPLHSIFWVLSFCLYLTMTENRKVFSDRRLYLALVAGIATGLGWFVYAYITDRSAFWDMYVVHETLEKRGGNGGTILAMWRDFLISLFPMTLIVVGTAVYALIKPERRARLALVTSWVVVPAAFFTYFPYRTETYLYVTAPAFAILVDLFWTDCMRSTLFRSVYRLNAAILGVAMLGVALLFYFPGFIPFWCAVMIAVFGIVVGVSAWSQSPIPHLVGVLGVILAIRLAAISLGENDVRGLREHFAARPQSQPVFVDVGCNWWNEFGLLSVAAKRPGIRVHNYEAAAAQLLQGHTVVLSNDDAQMGIPRIETLLHAQRTEAKTETVSWHRWNRGFLFPKLQDLKTMVQQDTPEWNARFKREYKLVRLK